MTTNYFIGGYELQDIQGTTVNVNVPRNSWTDPTEGMKSEKLKVKNYHAGEVSREDAKTLSYAAKATYRGTVALNRAGGALNNVCTLGGERTTKAKLTGSTMCRSCVGTLSTRIARMIACVLMCVIVSIGQAWGANAYVQSKNGSTNDTKTNISTATLASSGTAGKVSWSATSGSKSNTQWKIATNSSVTFTVQSGYEIQTIVLNSNSTAAYFGTWTTTAGTVSVGTGNDANKATVSNINASSVTLTNTATSEARLSAVTVTYAAASKPKLTTPTASATNITTTTTTLQWSSVTGANGGYEVVVKQGSTTKETTTVAAGTTSYNITGLTASTAYTATVKALAGSSTTNSDSEVSTAVNWTTAAPAQRTITWSVNGSSWTAGNPTTSVTDGQKPSTLPTAPTTSECDGSKVFVGWTNAPVIDGNKPSTLFTTADGAPTVLGSNATFYAVFATAGTGGSKTITLTPDDFYSSYQTEVKTITKEGVDLKYWRVSYATYGSAGNANYLKYIQAARYQSEEANRGYIYNDTEVSLSTIKIKYTNGGSGSVYNFDCYVSKENPHPGTTDTKIDAGTTGEDGFTPYDVSGYKYFTLQAPSNAPKALSIEITCGGVSYSDYTTTCSGVTRPATPTVDVPAGTYTSAQNVSVTNVPSGMTAYYTTDGREPDKNSTPYSTPININNSCTLKVVIYDSANDIYSNVAEFVYAIELPSHIIWMVNGSEQTLSPASVAYNTAIGTLPTPNMENICDGYEFMGWTTEENYTHATQAPTYITTTTKPTGNTTYYAVFAREMAGGTGVSKSVTFGKSDFKTEGGFTTATNTEVTITGGGHNTASGDYIVFNKNANSEQNYITVSGKKITAVSFEHSDDGYDGNLNTNDWTKSNNDMTWTKAVTPESNKATLRAKSVTITYESAPYGDFKTTCSCDEGVVSLFNLNGEANRDLCLHQVGTTTAYISSTIKLPSTANGDNDNFWVSVGSGNWTDGKSANKKLSDLRLADPRPNKYVLTQAGMYGKFVAFSDSQDKNFYVGFRPDWQITYGVSGQTWQKIDFAETATEYKYETAMLTAEQLAALKIVNTNFYVGARTDGNTAYLSLENNTGSYNKMTSVTGNGMRNGDKIAAADGGKFEIWSNSGDNNAYCGFIPYYTLKYDKVDGNAQGEMTPNELATGSTTVKACGFTAPTGKTFMGWSTQKGEHAGVVYQPGETYTFGDSRNNATNTLYAVWADAYTVTWIAGTETIKTETVAEGNTTTAPDVTACEKNEIVGWTTTSFPGVQNTSPEAPLSLNGTTGQINGNTTYYAVYKRTDASEYALNCIHKVTLMNDGMVHETQWIEHGKNAQNPSTNGRKPTACDEWAQASNTAWTLTEITTEQTEQPTYRGFGTGVTEDITLYAVFSKAGGSTPLADNTYRLATSTDDLVEGSKVVIMAWGYTFVGEDYEYELTDDYMLSIEDQTSSNSTSRKAYRCNETNGQTDTSSDWLTLTNAAASCVFTLEAGAAGTYTLKGNNNKYLSTVSSKDHLVASDDAINGNWNISFDEDNVATLQHGDNPAADGSLIRCAKSGEGQNTAIYFTAYGSTKAAQHTPVHLYVHTNEVCTYTTSPNCGPKITVTGNVNVTAAPNTTARSVGTLDIEATNLDSWNKVSGANEPHYFSATSTNSHFQIAWVGEDGEVKTPSTKINAGSFNIANGNTTWNTRLTVFYTPDANAENTTETTTIKIYVTSNNNAGNESTKCAECELEVTGRVLPRQFALVAAVTKGEEENETTTYYALPNNMSKSDGNDIQARTWSGLEVMLDNNGALVNPPAEAVYSAIGLEAVGEIPTLEGIQSMVEFSNNNRYYTQYVRLIGANNLALWSDKANTIKNAGNKQMTNVWQLQTEDMENYYIAHQPRLNESKPTYLLYNTGADYFGAYKKAADKLSLRIVPIATTDCNYYPAPALEALNVEHNAATIKVSMPNGFSQFNIAEWECRLNNGEWTRATETPIALTNLTQSTTYTVEVRAVATITDACETNRKVASVTFTTPKEPCDIRDLRATVSPTSAKLEWSGNATNLNLYQYSDALGNGMTLVQENVTSGYIWNNLSMGKYYYYSIGNNECLSPISSFITNNNAFDIVEWKVDSIVIEPWIDIAGMNFEIEQEQTEEVTGEERLKTQTLLISKYFEGAGDLKMVAIYNGTGAAVNLDNYVLRQTIRAYKVRDGQPASYGVNETKDIALSSLGTIKDKQEIIFYTWPQKQSTGNLGALYNLSETFLSQREAEEYSGVNAQTRWVGCGKNRKTNTNLTFSTDLSFNGDDMIQLIFKNGTEETLIDQFGATNPKNCPTMRNCGNEVGWEGMCSNMDYGKSLDDLNEGVSEDKQLTSTDQLADMKINTTDVRIPLHTARVIMFRSNLVTSGATTANSGSDFATLETEWVGRNLCRESNDAELTVFAYEALGNMNFAQYFTSYVSYVESKPFTGNGAKNNGDGTYTVPADRGTKGTEGYTNLQNIACQNIRIKITEGTGDSKNIIASQEVKVPIMITPEMTTAGGEATNQPTYITNDTRITTPNSAKLEHDDDHNPVLAGKDYTICKDCDVVILSGARLQVEADDPTEQTVNIDGEDIPVALQARDVYVYDGAKLILDNDVYFNTLTIRAKEDEVAVANLQNFLHLTDDDGLHHDKRIKGTRWYFFSLPYDCYIEDVTWANGNTATYGVDWLLQTYDGKKRADDAAEGATITANYYLWKDYTPEKDDKYDGIIHAGTGFMIAIEVREGHDYRTLRFPMAVGHRIDDNGINQYNAREAGTDNRNGNSVKEVPVYAWGAKKDYLDRTTGAYTNTEGGTVRATNIGWNLIGVPFTDTYTPIKGISSSSSSSDNGLYTSIGVTYDAAIKANYEAVLMTYELDSEQPTSTNINVVNYAKYDADGNQDGYEQYFTDIRLNQEKAEGRYYIMKPFLAYFVQVPGRAVAEYGENNTVISVGDVSSIEKLENSKEFVLRFEPKGATDHYDANTQQSISRRRIGEEPTYYQAEAKRIYVELKLTNPRQESDFTTIRMHNAFKDKYEVGNDMTKMRGSAYANFTTPVLASQLKAGHEAGSDLAFQCLPDSSVQNLPITYWVAEQGTYTFSLSRITDFEYIREAYLFDAETQTYTNLLLGNYEFTSTRGNFTNRFYLNIVPNREIPDPVIETPDPTTGLENSSVSGVGVSVSQDGQIYLYSLPMGSELYFFNAEGKLLYADQTNRSAYELNAPAAGVYFIRIHHNGEARTMKAIVK